MKKRFLALFLALLTLLTMLAGCGSAKKQPTEKQKSSLPWTVEDCSYKMGRLNRLEGEQNAVNSVNYAESNSFEGEKLVLFRGFERNTAYVKGASVVYDDATTMLMGLRRGDFQLGYVPTSLGRYIVSRNDDINLVEIDNDVIKKLAAENDYSVSIDDDDNESGAMGNLTYRMATLPDRAELCDTLNGAIQALKEDGTLTKLEAEYIEKVISGKDPEPIEMPKNGKWDTIRVAVTGDLPPMDYVSADGKPAGFNVALLSAVSEKIGLNIELVPMNTGSRLINMTSGLVDAIFWAATPENVNWDLAAGSDSEITDIVLTDPYYTTSQCFLYTDYPLEYIMAFEFYRVPEDKRQELLDISYWQLAAVHFSDIDKSGILAYQQMMNYLKETMSDEEIDEFLRPYLDYVPWFNK